MRPRTWGREASESDQVMRWSVKEIATFAGRPVATTLPRQDSWTVIVGEGEWSSFKEAGTWTPASRPRPA